MEPLSAVASVIAVLQISQGIISVCKEYIAVVKDAPSDLRKIMIEIGGVKSVFDVIQLLASEENDNDDDEILLQKLAGPDGPLEGCRHALAELERLFPKSSEGFHNGKRQKIAKSLVTLAWPFKRDLARSILEEITRYKATISLALSAETTLETKEIKLKVDNVYAILSDAERIKIIEWLVTTDPSSNHNAAIELHEPRTSKWLLESAEYLSWIDCGSRFLWLHGIPGAGKTVLFSSICADVQRKCTSPIRHDYGWAYYYCYFKRNQCEASPFLEWAISQLCRQLKKIPTEVHEVYEGGVRPSVKQLRKLLASVCKLFPRVYLLIDALDESKNRSTLLALLSDVSAELQNVQILAMSRKELDIKLALEPFSVELSLSNPFVDADIKTYLLQQIGPGKFHGWSTELCVKVIDALTRGAKGMFRWVHCQLEILRRLKFERDILKAITQLPKTLDETYERILCNVTPENHTYVHKVLQLLSYDFSIEYLDQIHTALAVDVELLTYNELEAPCDPLAIVDMCTCLITCLEREGRTEIKLAHYTVKEYLVHDRILKGPASNFNIRQERAYGMAAKCYIVYMLRPTTTKYNRNFKDFTYCAITRWQAVFRHLFSMTMTPDNSDELLDSEEQLLQLIVSLFDPNRRSFTEFATAFREFSYESGGGHNSILLGMTVKPGMNLCFRLAWFCSLRLPIGPILDKNPDPIPFNLPFASIAKDTARFITKDGSSLPIHDISLIDIAATEQDLGLLAALNVRQNDSSHDSQIQNALFNVLQSVICSCPETVHPVGDHLGYSLDALGAIEMFDSSGTLEWSQLLLLSLDDELRMIFSPTDVDPWQQFVSNVPRSALDITDLESDEAELDFEFANFGC